MYRIDKTFQVGERFIINNVNERERLTVKRDVERSLCTRVFPIVVSKTWYRQSIRLWITRSRFAN